MFGLESLDVLIGLITVYLMFALACTAIVEAISSWMSVRSKKLEAALEEFFNGKLTDNKQFLEEFYGHPLMQALSEGTGGRPSYIPPQVVSQVVESLITGNGVVTSLKDAVDKLPGTVTNKQTGKTEDNRIKGLLKSLETQASGNADEFRKAVEKHFDAVMDRASGWVKRRQQLVALLVSAALVIFANIDTFTLASALSSNPESRAKMVAAADQLLKNEQAVMAGKEGTAAKTESSDNAPSATDLQQIPSEGAMQALSQAKGALESGGLQFGWKDEDIPRKPAAAAGKMMGLLISIFAISLGAPFWFDLLQRFMRVRQSGISPREKENAKS